MINLLRWDFGLNSVLEFCLWPHRLLYSCDNETCLSLSFYSALPCKASGSLNYQWYWHWCRGTSCFHDVQWHVQIRSNLPLQSDYAAWQAFRGVGSEWPREQHAQQSLLTASSTRCLETAVTYFKPCWRHVCRFHPSFRNGQGKGSQALEISCTWWQYFRSWDSVTDCYWNQRWKAFWAWSQPRSIHETYCRWFQALPFLSSILSNSRGWKGFEAF